MKKKPLVFGIGQCSLDYLGLIDEYPAPDIKCECSNLVVQGGGPAATALVALKRWGCDCCLAGVVGDDDFGGRILSSLDEEGIDRNGVLVRKGRSSQFAFIVSERSRPRRTIFWRRPTGNPLQSGEVNLERLASSSALHTDGLFIEASLTAAESAKRAGIPVIVDAGTLRDGMLELAVLSDCFVTSEDFSKALGGTPEETCRILADLGVRLAGVTLGSNGSIVLYEGRFIRKAAFTVEVVDTTGCGDVFHAALTYSILKGWNIEKTLDFAGWAAAMTATRLGGRSGIPTALDIEARFP